VGGGGVVREEMMGWGGGPSPAGQRPGMGAGTLAAPQETQKAGHHKNHKKRRTPWLQQIPARPQASKTRHKDWSCAWNEGRVRARSGKPGGRGERRAPRSAPKLRHCIVLPSPLARSPALPQPSRFPHLVQRLDGECDPPRLRQGHDRAGSDHAGTQTLKQYRGKSARCKRTRPSQTFRKS
jgi:hypothetical protein